ncbi:unnamed protein product [Effrenium voratum]|uniref:Kinesin motor domain-containing protein n=1 Tax=Effrenium voratum TaxID=2562239 RepID=A0AA36J7I3_9DINO|nr:unnamed protein product [Effrenium voratum]
MLAAKTAAWNAPAPPAPPPRRRREQEPDLGTSDAEAFATIEGARGTECTAEHEPAWIQHEGQTGESSEDCTSASNLESARVDLQPLHEPSENQPGVCVEHQPSQAKSPAETSHQELTTSVEQQALQESFQENDASGMELVPDLCIQPLCTQVALTEDCATVMGGPTKCVEPQQAELDGKDGAALSKGTAEPTRKASLEALASSGSGAEASPRAESEVDVKLDKAIPAVQICIRLRPMLQWEKSDGYTHSAMQLKEDDGTISLKEEGRNRQFRFNRVIGEERTQQEVWDMSGIEDVVGKVALGFHATVFAYGQTGTGKTHTMEGFNYEHFCGSAPSAAASRPRVKAKTTPADQLGIVPRAVLTLFDRVEAMRRTDTSAVVRVSFLQIYNEKIFDLLNPSLSVAQRETGGRGEEFAGLRLRWDAAKRHFFVENLFQYECASAEEALQHYQTGIANKQVASTTMNVASSRSHTLLTLTLARREEREEAAAPREVVSQLSLVDLAGSERSVASGGMGRSSTRFHEAINVNQSLFVLRRVITALSKREKPEAKNEIHVPYRESKLTSLLHNSLGGNSYLVMFACLAPADRHDDENLSTLQYASQAACIRNLPAVNVDPKDRMIQQLEARLATAHEYLLRALGVPELPEDLLEEERQALERVGGRRLRPTKRAKTWEFRDKAPRPPRAEGNLAGNSPAENAGQAGQPGQVGQPGPAARGPAGRSLGQSGQADKASRSCGPSQTGQVKAASQARTLPRAQMSRSFSGYGTPAALHRIVQGAAQKSPSSSDWPFSARRDNSEGRELFEAVDAMMRGYDGPVPPPKEKRRPKPRPASLPPVRASGSRCPHSMLLHGDSGDPWPKKGRDSPAADSVQSAETAVASMASKCSCASDRSQTQCTDVAVDIELSERHAEAMEELKSAQSAQGHLEGQLLAAHQRIQELEIEVCQGQPVSEVQQIKSENAELHQRLEVFYKAMEQKPDGEQKDVGMSQKIEKFHSQLVLEAVTLRNEVARLKKKKWIIKAVLDSGGEHERQAIIEEVEQLRLSKREAENGQCG